MAPRSIRRQLLVCLLGAVAVTWLATAVVSYFEARHELDELLDAHLAQAASLLVAQAGREPDEVEFEHSPQLHRYGRGVAFQFWENGTTLRLHSANAPATRLSALVEGFSDAILDGEQWRVFSGWDGGRHFLVQVGERREARDEIVATIAKNLLWPMVIALPALGLLLWFGIERATRPLRLLNRQVENRAPGNLVALDAGDAPAEVTPLVASLNRLFARVAASIENERRFTADAAHELRTPLAALRAQAQVARSARDDAERGRALDQVLAGCDRAAHLIDQLLTLARIEPEQFHAHQHDCELHEIVRLAIADLAPAAIARLIDIELASGPEVRVPGDARLLGILLRNLLDNAVRYSPPETTVHAKVERRAAGAFVTVTDEGPGVPPDERKHLGRRFHRGIGTGAAGTGLGLSIAMRIAQLHGATLDFGDTPYGAGLAVTLAFGRAEDAPDRRLHAAAGSPA